MLGQFDSGMIKPQFGLHAQRADQNMAEVWLGADMIGGQAGQPAAAQPPGPAVADMDKMTAPPAQGKAGEGGRAVGHAVAAPLGVQPAIIGGERDLHPGGGAQRIGNVIESLDQGPHRQFRRGAAFLAAANPVRHCCDQTVARALRGRPQMHPPEVLVLLARPDPAGKARRHNQLARIAHIFTAPITPASRPHV